MSCPGLFNDPGQHLLVFLLSLPFDYLPCSVSRPEHPPDVVNICLEYLRTNYQVSSNHVIELGKLLEEKCWSLF